MPSGTEVGVGERREVEMVGAKVDVFPALVNKILVKALASDLEKDS